MPPDLEYESDEDMPPELEDMSATIAAARKMRTAPAPTVVKHESDLYSAIVDDPYKPAPEIRPLEVDTRVKVVGLAKAAQYNGQSAVIKGFDNEAGRYMVQLKNGKELKIKRGNMELVDGAVKGGFLSQKQCTKSTDTSGPEIVRPTGKKEGVLDGMKSLKIDQNNVPDWMKPNEDLLKKVNADKELASAVNNAKLTKAIDEVAKDPSAWLKYQNDPEVKSYFAKMMGLFGQQYEEHEAKNEKNGQQPNQGKAAGTDTVKEAKLKTRLDPDQEILTAGGLKTSKPQTTKKCLIQEISCEDAGASSNQRPAAAEAARRPPSPKRKGTTDYSKWALIDDEEEDALSPAPGPAGRGGAPVKEADALGIPGLSVGRISESDPRVVAAKADPRVQRLLLLLRTSAESEAIERMMGEPEVAEKMRLLIQAGVVDILRPSQ